MKDLVWEICLRLIGTSQGIHGDTYVHILSVLFNEMFLCLSVKPTWTDSSLSFKPFSDSLPISLLPFNWHPVPCLVPCDSLDGIPVHRNPDLDNP